MLVSIEAVQIGSNERLHDEETETSDGLRAEGQAAVPLPPVDPGRYHVVQERGRGGLGRVLEARDLRLGRSVALKEMLRESDTAGVRFVREAMITARLEHPSIVPVHDIGRWPSGEPFYSMKLVSGRSLQEVIAAAPSLDRRLALLPNVIAVADAIAYAHSAGVIHRDLKPANVLVGAFGETVVIDWGLAKDLRAQGEDAAEPEGEGALRGDGSLTRAGAVLGTPCYMPPEQARGAAVDERADVYALGALLYEVLSGAPPYHDAKGVLAAVLAGPPAPVEARERDIPPDLGAVVKKAMARRPEDRYPSARELAEDLRRFQTGRLVSAHRYSRWTLVARWLRRFRAPVGVGVAALLILAVIGVVSVRRVIVERNAARRRADQLLLAQARGALERDATEALMWLRTYPEDGEAWDEVRTVAMDAEGRGIAHHVPPRDGFFTFTADGRAWAGAPDQEHVELYDADTGARLRALPHRGRVSRMVASPDGHTLALVDVGDRAVTLLDLVTGTARRLPEHPGPVMRLAASPDGRWIASASSDGTLQLSATAAGGETRALRGHEGDVYTLSFSGDSRWLFSMAAERTAARLWEVGGSGTRALMGPRDPVEGDVSPDGSLVALTQRDGAVSLWSAASGALVRAVGHHTGKANGIAFSPDGRWIASAGSDGIILVTSVTGDVQRRLTGHRSAARWVAFSPDGRLLASGSDDGEVRLWQVEGDEERVLGRSPGRAYLVGFSPDGRHLFSRASTLSIGFEGRIWDVTTQHRRGLRCHEGSAFHVVFSPDGRRMATSSEDKAVCLWDARTGESRRLTGHEGIVYRAAFSPDGSTLASASFDGTVRLWDLRACDVSLDDPACAREARVLAGHSGTVWTLAFSPDGRRLATGGADATVRLWDLSTGEAEVMRGHRGSVVGVAFSPDGALLASAGEDGALWRWDLSGGGRRLGAHDEQALGVAFAGGGRWIVTSSGDQTVRRWDAVTGASEVLASGLGLRSVFATVPGDREVVVSGDLGRVLLVDLETRSTRPIGVHRSGVYDLAVSPDGAWLASAGRDHTMRLWSLGRGTLDAVLQHDFEVRSVAFSPDGRTVAAAGMGPVVRLSSVAAGAAPLRDPRSLTTWMATLSTATFDPLHDVANR